MGPAGCFYNVAMLLVQKDTSVFADKPMIYKPDVIRCMPFFLYLSSGLTLK